MDFQHEIMLFYVPEADCWGKGHGAYIATEMVNAYFFYMSHKTSLPSPPSPFQNHGIACVFHIGGHVCL